MNIIVYKSKKMVDKSGERIHFEKPYFDEAFRRHFHSVEEKKTYMDKIGAISVGDSEAKRQRQIKEHNEMKNDIKR